MGIKLSTIIVTLASFCVGYAVGHDKAVNECTTIIAKEIVKKCELKI